MQYLSIPFQVIQRFRSFLQKSRFFWWVEINTAVPSCTYYFGPFDSQKEALDSMTGYIEDLDREKASGIVALVKKCQPDQLTIDRDGMEYKAGHLIDPHPSPPQGEGTRHGFGSPLPGERGWG